jgi:hypothetical protein
LQQAQLADQPAMSQSKIVYPEFSQGPKYCMDEQSFYLSNKCFFIPGTFSLLAYLNSRAVWFWIFGEASPLRGGKWRLELREQYIARIPIPNIRAAESAQLEKLGRLCTNDAKRSFEIKSTVSHRILTDLAPPECTRLSRKLEEWWRLDFTAFRTEMKRILRTEIPVKERAEWEAYLAGQAVTVRKLDAEIEKTERKIDAIVYRLLDLATDEIALLEASIAGQY